MVAVAHQQLVEAGPREACHDSVEDACLLWAQRAQQAYPMSAPECSEPRTPDQDCVTPPTSHALGAEDCLKAEFGATTSDPAPGLFHFLSLCRWLSGVP